MMDLPNDEKNIEEFVDEHRSTQSMKSGSDSPQIKYTERKIRKRINSGNSGASGGKIVTKKYEVAKIRAVRQVTKGKSKWNEYLVRWKGYGAEEDQWLQGKHLKGCRYLMQKFRERRLREKMKDEGSTNGRRSRSQSRLTAATAAKVNSV